MYNPSVSSKTLKLVFLLSLRLSSATLTFEGLQDGRTVNDYYNSLGVSFTGAIALVDTDDGGSGDFGGEPSSSTAIFSLTGIIVDAPGGLTGLIQFYYANPYGTTNVRVYSGPALRGTLLFDALLNATLSGASGDPTGLFGPFVLSTATFSGVARSLAIVPRAPNGVFIDDLTFTSVPEPEPFCLWMIGISGLLAYSAIRRHWQGRSFSSVTK